MNSKLRSASKPLHPWLKKVKYSFLPEKYPTPEGSDPLLEIFTEGLLNTFAELGHEQVEPGEKTDVLFHTARLGDVTPLEESLMVTGSLQYGLPHKTPVYTLMSIHPKKLHALLTHFKGALEKEAADPWDFDFPGLAPKAHEILHEYGRPSGPEFLLARVLQAQLKNFNLLLVIGEDSPLMAYHFDLVGGRPRVEAKDLDEFFRDMALRVVTRISTRTVSSIEVEEEKVPLQTWQSLSTPIDTQNASREFGNRHLFSKPIHIAEIAQIPDSFPLDSFMSRQYSDGCYATWDPRLGALLTTVTGSAHPVDKGNLDDEGLALITRMKEDGSGVVVRHVEGRKNHPPSVEAVELIDMHQDLPFIRLDASWGHEAEVPVMRSKLHFHRGVASYDPKRVEFVPLDAPYYDYLITCSLEAQAWALKTAFTRSEAFRNPEDPRQIVFTLLPAHGVVMAEKWVKGKKPFQLFWEFIDEGLLKIENNVPQGRMSYVSSPDGRHVIRSEQGDWEEALKPYAAENMAETEESSSPSALLHP